MSSEILLIDDEKDIRFAVHEILKENNFLYVKQIRLKELYQKLKKNCLI